MYRIIKQRRQNGQDVVKQMKTLQQPTKPFKGVTIVYKPCVWICPLKNGGIYFMWGTNNIIEGKSSLWNFKNKIRTKLFHLARKNIQSKISRRYLNYLSRKNDIQNF